MPWIAGGILGVILLVAGMGAIANANPARLARAVRWLGIAVLLALGLAFLVRGIYMPAFLCWSGAGLLWAGIKRGRGGMSGQGPARASDVETEWVRMSLDLDTGATTGTVLRGALAGRRVEELSLIDLRALLAEARINDPDAARLVEAFIRRSHPDADPEAANDSGLASAHGMTCDEALRVLGLEAGADGNDIREAHRRLMQQVHPDKGGSDYLASKINEARDVLLKDA